jgi:hypothetical protein
MLLQKVLGGVVIVTSGGEGGTSGISGANSSALVLSYQIWNESAVSPNHVARVWFGCALC